MTEAGWAPNSEVESAIDELKAQVQKIYNAGYQQGRVAGLRDAEVIAQFMVMATPSNVAAALRFMADKLEAQQAQDEKGVGDA